MATQTTGSSHFISKRQGGMYGTYNGGFIAFVIPLAIAEQVGVREPGSRLLFVFSIWRFTRLSAL